MIIKDFKKGIRSIFHSMWFWLGMVFLFVSCSTSNPPADPDHAAEEAHLSSHGHEDEEEHVSMERLQKEIIGLKLGSFEYKVLRPRVKMKGSLETPPFNRAEVNSLMAGQVHKIHIKPGQYIKKGGLLASLRNTELVDWQQMYLQTLASLQFLEKENARQKVLAEKEVVAVKQYEKISSEYAMALAQKKGLETKFRMLGIPLPEVDGNLVLDIPIRSPISGYIKEIFVAIGTSVPKDVPLFEIVNNHHIHVDLRVFEKDLAYLSENQKLEFNLQSDPKQVYGAYILSLGKALDPQTRTAVVHAELEEENPSLLPGMYVEARALMEADTSFRSLPESAIITDKELSYIFVLDEELEHETHYRRVQVLTGAREMGYVEVRPIELLSDDTQVVTEGAFYLLAQMKKGEEGAGGHSHDH